MLELTKTDYIECQLDVETGAPEHCCQDCKMEWPLAKPVCRSLTNGMVRLWVSPLSTPRYLPQKGRTFVHTQAWMQLSVAGLFVTAPNWKQCKSVSLGEWDKLVVVYPYTRVPLSNKKLWMMDKCFKDMNLKVFWWVKEARPSQKSTYCIISII